MSGKQACDKAQKVENIDDCLAFKKTNQNTQEVKNEKIFSEHKKTIYIFSACIAFNTATDGQTDINHKKD